ncbi:uncharacterized protein MONOS_15841 [Monocercomonoides exilis]|uniref:uncharacterized protein n=1 Tax=Monocercomonoides exilis TaxID=2049356 RepID=UPI0035597FCE|nr:hypothetical protein MONOS_15841 [Monocercomonoides exilis]|eukprot:MONOS_15841.1-p1 / transcript=MONOS_15841.1 / gene=MONOS_15841 / organism=Monocercomonoides_exilis_PA203 / gene_product=unspecified product / transcript_product=unspecified product / location=Mono_scaffold01375:2800-3276(-) / protein_length=159 / sequence_SO=supercontig / SO=protein_coding / is_pseudo=false
MLQKQPQQQSRQQSQLSSNQHHHHSEGVSRQHRRHNCSDDHSHGTETDASSCSPRNKAKRMSIIVPAEQLFASEYRFEKESLPPSPFPKDNPQFVSTLAAETGAETDAEAKAETDIGREGDGPGLVKSATLLLSNSSSSSSSSLPLRLLQQQNANLCA